MWGYGRLIKRLQSIIHRSYAGIILLLLVCIWQLVYMFKLVPGYMLPSPIQVGKAFIREFDVLMVHLSVSLTEAFVGLLLSIVGAFLLAMLMDRFQKVYQSIYPLLIISQTIPVIAIAPLLVLWMGYGIAPKVMVIFIVCLGPITIGLLDGFKNCDRDAIRLIQSMGASRKQIFWHMKLPFAMPHFLSGLKISVSYAVIAAVVAEWLGGNKGLGVYMTRVRKSYAFDEMFAVIFLVSIVSLILMKCVALLERKLLPYKESKEEGR